MESESLRAPSGDWEDYTSEAGPDRAEDTVRPAPLRPTRHVGRKFLSDGRVRPFSGNTIICHLPQQGEHAAAFDALLDIYRETPRHAFMRKVTLLPPSSYHVTIFAGAHDEARRPGMWPADLPLDLPVDECNARLAERLKGFRLDASLPLRFRIDETSSEETPLTIHLLPADAAEETRLRRLRDRLSDLLAIRGEDHDRYRFHVTLGYTIHELDPPERAAFASVFRDWRARLARQVPVIELGAPEYCVLDDMFAFHRQFYLGA